MSKPTKTNLELLDVMTYEMIDTTNAPPLTEKLFKTAKWRKPKPTVKVTVETEPEVIEWFKAQDDNYGRYLAAALRIYAQAHFILESA